jgi:hypothetical protein
MTLVLLGLGIWVGTALLLTVLYMWAARRRDRSMS